MIKQFLKGFEDKFVKFHFDQVLEQCLFFRFPRAPKKSNILLQNPSISSTLRRHGENIAEKSITVCSGLDMVNINLTHFVFSNKEDADVSVKIQERTTQLNCFYLQFWRYSLCALTNNVKMNNVNPMTNLEKQ